MDLLRRRLWMSFDVASTEFGAMISCPSTRLKVVENKPNSLTKSTWGVVQTGYRSRKDDSAYLVINHH